MGYSLPQRVIPLVASLLTVHRLLLPHPQIRTALFLRPQTHCSTEYDLLARCSGNLLLAPTVCCCRRAQLQAATTGRARRASPVWLRVAFALATFETYSTCSLYSTPRRTRVSVCRKNTLHTSTTTAVPVYYTARVTTAFKHTHLHFWSIPAHIQWKATRNQRQVPVRRTKYLLSASHALWFVASGKQTAMFVQVANRKGYNTNTILSSKTFIFSNSEKEHRATVQKCGCRDRRSYW